MILLAQEERVAIIKAAALALVDAALELIQRDPHQWSEASVSNVQDSFESRRQTIRL